MSPDDDPNTPPGRDAYHWFCDMPTRWMDNDVYGHVNNVVYYSYFDSAANRFLIERGGLDIHAGDVVAFVVDSRCQYHAPVAFPDRLTAGVRVEHLGRRSVRWGIAIFAADQDTASAHGYFVHVFVARGHAAATAIPPAIRRALEGLAASPGRAFE